MKNIKKIDTKKIKAKSIAEDKARQALNRVGLKAVSGCPELTYNK